MKARSILSLTVLLATMLATASSADAHLFGRFRGGDAGPSSSAWNTNYYDPAWGMPEALVVPPTVHGQWNYSWGVGGSRLCPIGAQYQFQAPGPESVYVPGNYRPTPVQPSDTIQFGVNAVRAPR